MKSVRFALEALRLTVVDLARRPLATGLALAAMASAVFVLASFMIVSRGASDLLERWTDEAVVEVYIAQQTPRERIDALATELRARADVVQVAEVSPERALEEFEQAYPGLEGVDDVLESNPFPASLRVVPRDTGDVDIDALVAYASAQPGVSGVRYDKQWLEKLRGTAKTLGWAMLIGGGVLLLAALITIGSVVRLTLEDKREEVRLMRLIGAPTLVVATPVLLTGALLGTCGAVIAIAVASTLANAIAYGTAEGMQGWLQPLFGQGLPPGRALTLVAAGALIGALSAGLTAGRQALR